ncbi:MAG: hypothetical protein IPF99_26050 [Deltaproteobacteria bacterium]|nr:hypothetical protein [Deltaproteobacteria bacterium]
MSFVDEVKSAIQGVERTQSTHPAFALLAVVRDLAEGLSDESVRAVARGMGDPRRVGLYLHPAHRPQRGQYLLTFFFDGEGVTVSGEKSIRYTDPEGLKKWLIDFVTLPAFIESLQILREEATRPVEARLRRSAALAYSQGDVMVEVSAADQKKLDETAAYCPSKRRQAGRLPRQRDL